MLRKRAGVNMPARQESPYFTRCALIGLLLIARQISQHIEASDKITAIAVSI